MEMLRISPSLFLAAVIHRHIQMSSLRQSWKVRILEYLDGAPFLRFEALTLGGMGWDLDGNKKGGKKEWEKPEDQRTEEEF